MSLYPGLIWSLPGLARIYCQIIGYAQPSSPVVECRIQLINNHYYSITSIGYQLIRIHFLTRTLGIISNSALISHALFMVKVPCQSSCYNIIGLILINTIYFCVINPIPQK